MKKVVFICRGNMFRSVMAKFWYNALKKDDSMAESYGTMVEVNGDAGKRLTELPIVEGLVSEMSKIGFDISNEVCKQLKPELLVDAERVISMAEEQYTPDWLRDVAYEKWEVPDREWITPEIAKIDIEAMRMRIEKMVRENA